jgi:phosphoesterase RecJ-like protein
MNHTEAAEWLRSHDGYLILTHRRPDGDTLGCAAGLCQALRQLGKTAYVLTNPETTSTYLKDVESYFAPEGYEPETVVSVDTATLGLLPDNAKAYQDRIAFAFDHHPSYEGFAPESCVDASCAACGELIYRVCQALGPITAEVAKPLYVAVSTDTGCFVYSNTTSETHQVAAELMKYGDFYKEVNKRCFRTKSLKRLKLESLLVEGMEVYDDGLIAVAAISLDMMEQVGATEADAEDLAAFVGQVEGVKISATIRELRPGECKISLRTDANLLNATETCALLGGGGHAAASGATVNGTVEEAKQAILQAIWNVKNRSFS